MAILTLWLSSPRESVASSANAGELSLLLLL
jgi:hypothetical protein